MPVGVAPGAGLARVLDSNQLDWAGLWRGLQQLLLHLPGIHAYLCHQHISSTALINQLERARYGECTCSSVGTNDGNDLRQIALVWEALLSSGVQRVRLDSDHVFEMAELLPELHVKKCGSGLFCLQVEGFPPHHMHKDFISAIHSLI